MAAPWSPLAFARAWARIGLRFFRGLGLRAAGGYRGPRRGAAVVADDRTR